VTRTRNKPDKGNVRLQRILDENKPEGQEYLRECSICGGPFDLDKEGGTEGCIGIIPVSFCPTCKAGVFDFVEQSCPRCQGIEDD
jgi:hypothetical protein